MAGRDYYPSHMAMFRTGNPYAPVCAEPAYSTSTSVPPLGYGFGNSYNAQRAAAIANDEPFGPPKPSDEIMNLKPSPRPINYRDLSKEQKKMVDWEIANQKAAIKAAQKQEAARAKQALAYHKSKVAKHAKFIKEEKRRLKLTLSKIVSEAEKEINGEAFVRARIHAADLKYAGSGHSGGGGGYAGWPMPHTTPWGAFWAPPPCAPAYRRPMESSDGWPLMSRTMNQAIHDFEYEDRLIRTANGQILGLL